jgi:hypothetical protein
MARRVKPIIAVAPSPATTAVTPPFWSYMHWPSGVANISNRDMHLATDILMAPAAAAAKHAPRQGILVGTAE